MQTRGFTLIEMLVVIGMITVVGFSIQYAIAYFYRANAYVLQGTAAINSARTGITTMSSNLREATYGDDGSYPIAAAGTSTITFFADVDKDGGVEKVRIYSIGTTLYRAVTNAGGNPPSYTGQAQATTTLATYVANGTSTPLFRYYNDNGSEITGTINLAQIASIQMTLRVDINPSRAPDIYTLIETATIRNLRSE